jgi:hypothetical protein
MAGIKANAALASLAPTQQAVNAMFAALPKKKVKAQLYILVVNSDAVNAHQACVMNNVQNNYSAYGAIQYVTTPGGLTYSTNHPGGLAGIRDMIKYHRLHIIGFTYDVSTIDNVAQFDQPFDKISANSTNQDVVSFNDSIDNGKSDNDQEQFMRTITENFELNPSTDLVWTVGASMQSKLIFSVRGQAVTTK